MSPQWEGGLELGLDGYHEDEIEYEYENDEDSNYEELDSLAAGGARAHNGLRFAIASLRPMC